MDSLSVTAAKNVGDIIRMALKHEDSRKALVVYDLRTPLSRLITEAYASALPNAVRMDFDATAQADVLAAIQTLSPKDLVVLVQSSNFRLAEYRIRIELFQRGLAVIEHVHLERAVDERQLGTYVDALAYDTEYYRGEARRLKEKIDAAKTITVRCIGGTVLTYEGGMEDTKWNVGDYAGMKNVGGTFPIGEVFSEPRDFSGVNGEAMVFSFAGTDHVVQMHEPFKIVIEQGILTRHEGPPGFQEVLDQISSEEKILVREFGIGLNRAMDKTRVLDDITAFERQRGLHFSLGEKHGVYKKPGMAPKKTHFHIDIFVDVDVIEADGEEIFRV